MALGHQHEPYTIMITVAGFDTDCVTRDMILQVLKLHAHVHSEHIKYLYTLGNIRVWYLKLNGFANSKFYPDLNGSQFRFSAANILFTFKHLEDYSYASLYWVPEFFNRTNVLEIVGTIAKPFKSMYVQKEKQGKWNIHFVAMNVDQIPHYINVKYLTEYHVILLVLPGRASICYKCGQAGHGAGKCPNVSLHDERNRKAIYFPEITLYSGACGLCTARNPVRHLQCGGGAQTFNMEEAQAFNMGEARASNRGAVQTPNREAVQTPNRGAVQTPNRGAVQTPNREAVQTFTRGAMQTFNREEAQAFNMEEAQPSNRRAEQLHNRGAEQATNKSLEQATRRCASKRCAKNSSNKKAEKLKKCAEKSAKRRADQSLNRWAAQTLNMWAEQSSNMCIVKPSILSAEQLVNKWAAQTLNNSSAQSPNMCVVQTSNLCTEQSPNKGIKQASKGWTEDDIDNLFATPSTWKLSHEAKWHIGKLERDFQNLQASCLNNAEVPDPGLKDLLLQPDGFSISQNTSASQHENTMEIHSVRTLKTPDIRRNHTGVPDTGFNSLSIDAFIRQLSPELDFAIKLSQETVENSVQLDQKVQDKNYSGLAQSSTAPVEKPQNSLSLLDISIPDIEMDDSDCTFDINVSTDHTDNQQPDIQKYVQDFCKTLEEEPPEQEQWNQEKTATLTHSEKDKKIKKKTRPTQDKKKAPVNDFEPNLEMPVLPKHKKNLTAEKYFKKFRPWKDNGEKGSGNPKRDSSWNSGL